MAKYWLISGVDLSSTLHHSRRPCSLSTTIASSRPTPSFRYTHLCPTTDWANRGHSTQCMCFHQQCHGLFQVWGLLLSFVENIRWWKPRPAAHSRSNLTGSGLPKNGGLSSQLKKTFIGVWLPTMTARGYYIKAQLQAGCFIMCFRFFWELRVTDVLV